MYQVTVRDHLMIAHSFKGDAFGPAQALHGATYVVDVRFERPALDSNDMVVDIAAATHVLAEILAEFNLSNLDDHPDLAGHNTTTEFMAEVIFRRVRRALDAGRLGETGRGVRRLAVTLSESPTAWAGYESAL